MIRSVPQSGATLSDDELVAALVAGDTSAPERLIERYLPMMGRMAHRLVNPSDRDDVLQESVFQALRSMGRLRHGGGLAIWFGGIVLRVARKTGRRLRLLRRLGFVDAPPVGWLDAISPAAPADVVAELKAVAEVMDRLPARAREVLILRRIECRPLQEIADMMGASLASVKRWEIAANTLLEETMRKRQS